MEDRWHTDTERRDMTVWLFDEESFVPMAMIKEGRSYSILTDQLGTPTEAYDAEGNEVWSRVLDMDGNVIGETGNKGMVPFLFQGQYYDRETGLAYNRFRYYSPKMGMYVSQDPIGLAGRILNLYGYVYDTNYWVDVLGLSHYSKRVQNLPKALQRRPKWWKKTYDYLKRTSNVDEDGNYIDKKTGLPIYDEPVIGHQKESWREYQDNPANHNKTRAEVIADYNNVDNLGFESASSNSSNGARTKGLENS